MEHFIPIIVALLGSGAASSLIAVFMYRGRHDKYVDHLESWKNERDLLRSLEYYAGITTSESAQQSRDLAIATAARTQVNSAIAARLIPQNHSRFWLLFIGGLALLFMGLCIAMCGIIYTLRASELAFEYFFASTAFVGFVMLLMGFSLIFIALKCDLYRDIMRAEVQRVLNESRNHSASKPEPLAIKYNWLPGNRPEFSNRLHKLAIPPNVRQAFSYFMMNVESHFRPDKETPSN